MTRSFTQRSLAGAETIALGLLAGALCSGCGGPKIDKTIAPRASTQVSATATAPVAPRSWMAFVGVEEGRSLLGASDEFTRALGPLDRQLRMASKSPVDERALLAHISEQVIAWTPEAQHRWEAVAAKLHDALLGLALQLPWVVVIETTGKEEFNAAYSRGPAIVLPAHDVESTQSPLRLLAHELFHVASRHSPALRAQLYPLVGFHAVDAIAYPAELEPKRLTNPDAFLNAYAINVTSKGRQLSAVPLIFCTLPVAEALEAGLERSLDIQLVEVTGEGHAAVGPKGAPVVHAVGSTDYLKVASVNTGYAIHPEEVMADNFALLIARRAGEEVSPPHPEVLDAIEKALAIVNEP